MLGDRRIVLAAQHQAAVEEPTPDDIYTIGTLCEIKQILKMPEGQLRILVEGLERVVVHGLADKEGYYEATITVPEVDEMDERPESEGCPSANCARPFSGIRPGKQEDPAEVMNAIKSIADRATGRYSDWAA